ncbi:hypothetical protein DRO97_10650 [Archaeoglobales archaeon]|nr:MAG: hypothetical protein DRO97_10650 [Archaeoglobales archaeon]
MWVGMPLKRLLMGVGAVSLLGLGLGELIGEEPLLQGYPVIENIRERLERLREFFGREPEKPPEEVEKAALKRRIESDKNLTIAAKNDLLKMLEEGDIEKVKETLEAMEDWGKRKIKGL